MKGIVLAGIAGLMLLTAACVTPRPTQESMNDIYTAVAAPADTPTLPPPAAASASPSPTPTPSASPTITPTAGVVTQGLLAYFPFDEPKTTGDKLPDQSGLGNDGVVKGRPQLVAQGRLGGAYSLQAADYVALQRNPTANAQAFSVSVWFKTDDPDQDYKLASAASWQNSQGSGWVVGTRLSEAWSADHASLMTEKCYRQFKPEPGVWNHLVVTYDRVRFREYVNGRLSLDCPTTGQLAGPGQALEVGAWSPLPPFGFVGQLDDFRVYGRALSIGEVAKLYAPDLVAGLSDRLLAYYSFNQLSGGVIKDDSGSGNDAAVSGAPGFSSQGRLGSGYAFKNSNLVTLSRNPTAGLSTFAITLWFKTDRPEADTKLASAATWRDKVGSGWTIGTSFSEFWSDDNQPLIAGQCYRSIKPLAGQWNHLAVSYDGRQLKEYINGDLTTDCDTTHRPLGAGHALEIGGWTSLAGFDYTGLVDEFRVYGRSLAATEVLLIMYTGAGQ
jgi:hypothetical protein